MFTVGQVVGIVAGNHLAVEYKDGARGVIVSGPDGNNDYKVKTRDAVLPIPREETFFVPAAALYAVNASGGVFSVGQKVGIKPGTHASVTYKENARGVIESIPVHGSRNYCVKTRDSIGNLRGTDVSFYVPADALYALDTPPEQDILGAALEMLTHDQLLTLARKKLEF